jgi:nitrous oxidase accessory protein NosD
MLASVGGVAWATLPPTVTLEAGVHKGPLLLDHEQKLVGEPGAVVVGGIRITADGVVVRGLTVIGAEHGIEVDGATGVRLEDVRVSGASLDGINVRRGQVTIRDCIIQSTAPYAQGIDISFAFDLPPSLVEGCVLNGGLEGIVTHFAHVRVHGNRVSGTSLRGITITEMSMGSVEENDVRDALGVGIFCGDYSMCEIERNTVIGTRPDRDSSDGARQGYAIVAHFGSEAELDENTLYRNAATAGAFSDSSLVRR